MHKKRLPEAVLKFKLLKLVCLRNMLYDLNVILVKILEIYLQRARFMCSIFIIPGV